MGSAYGKYWLCLTLNNGFGSRKKQHLKINLKDIFVAVQLQLAAFLVRVPAAAQQQMPPAHLLPATRSRKKTVICALSPDNQLSARAVWKTGYPVCSLNLHPSAVIQITS